MLPINVNIYTPADRVPLAVNVFVPVTAQKIYNAMHDARPDIRADAVLLLGAQELQRDSDVDITNNVVRAAGLNLYIPKVWAVTTGGYRRTSQRRRTPRARSASKGRKRSSSRRSRRSRG